MENKNNLILHIGPEHPYNTPKKEKKSIKTILKDAGRQIFVTLLILIVTFCAMNWRALYINAKYKFEELTGTQEESKLIEVVEKEKKPQPKQKLVDTNQSTTKQIQEIPKLDLEVYPPDTRLVIPRIDQNLPVLKISSENLITKDWSALEKDMQEGLKYGVVHYPGTSWPDQTGNVVITGHSSYFPWDPGRFKDVFALLQEVVVGDKVALYYNQHKYVYEVSDIQIVLPSNIDILKQTPDKTLTLITCYPIGTNLKRIVVIADLIEEQI
ncbi:MAG: class D sortase [Candidatus Gracilibacteria bacterium]